ncbi:probable G-protein coupled receptor Mth-like 5 [Frankliniella occidentalis]|uniref:Probable G-protein coupled receptor Mth-like 5 n=1 Tax=Frankliniella occidentalis TaxID=133901 RepID=A0A6J1SGY6_FRAOC|nr:probable G-protein coupled receptor Mth-like 5 [Frankliniella occidentalis]
MTSLLNMLLLLWLTLAVNCNAMNDLDIPERHPLLIPKCCSKEEVINQLGLCMHVNETGVTMWKPKFIGEDGKEAQPQPYYELTMGSPECEQQQLWSIFSHAGSSDRLVLFPNGKLRHYTRDRESLEAGSEFSPGKSLESFEHNGLQDEPRFYDYMQGQYCLDKAILEDGRESIYSQLCIPKPMTDWTNTEFLISRVVDPLCHVFCIICFLSIAIVYFILPQLRDLVGNIITSISICLIVAQTADLVRTFTEFSSHVSFLVADAILYTSLLAAFFWINSMGYYVHRHFKSSNVFLRSTDGRKYCYYSCYVWGCTATLGIIALFAHFMFPSKETTTTLVCSANQRNVGWMGIAVFFVPVAVLVIINFYFWRSTAHTISRIQSFGRIHSKLKYSFQMFVKVFLVMTIAWLFFMLTWIPSPLLCYINISTNILQALLLLYICVLSQKRVTFHLRKTCCYDNCICTCCRPGEPTPETCEWGEEMHYIDTLDNFN